MTSRLGCALLVLALFAPPARAETDVTLDLPLSFMVRQITRLSESPRLTQAWRMGFGPRFGGRHGSIAFHVNLDTVLVEGEGMGRSRWYFGIGADVDAALPEPVFSEFRLGARVGFSHRNGDDPSTSGWRFEAGPRLVHPYVALEVDALVSSADAGTSVGWQVSITARQPRPVIAIVMAVLTYGFVATSIGHDP